MKRITAFFIAFFLIFNTLSFADELSEDSIVGETALLMDYNTGEILWEKDMNKQMYPASTTKMLTAIIILENHDLQERVVAPNDLITYSNPSIKHIAIDYGEELTVEQLMYALLVTSANDAANLLAVHHSGSIEAFALEMNEKAKAIGAIDSNFVNPHGLHDANHYSTAYDLALIGQYAFQNPVFREMVKTPKYVIPPTNKKDEAREYVVTSNRFINGTSSDRIRYKGEDIRIKYDIVDGIKTGYTTQAGNCLVSTASKNGVRYIAVVMNSNQDNNVYKDSRTLLDYGFDNFYTKTIVSRGAFVKTQKLDNSKLTINLVAGRDLTLTLDKNIKSENIESQITVHSNLVTPIKAGVEVGTIVYSYNNNVLGQVPLLTEYDITDSNLVSTLESGFIRLDENNQLDFMFYIGVFMKLLLSFIIYRTIITTYNLRKRRKRLEAKNASVESEQKDII